LNTKSPHDPVIPLSRKLKIETQTTLHECPWNIIPNTPKVEATQVSSRWMGKLNMVYPYNERNGVLILIVLAFELRASHLLSRHSTVWVMPVSLFFFALFIFQIKSVLFSWGHP
jgi:hypothetical protein